MAETDEKRCDECEWELYSKGFCVEKIKCKQAKKKIDRN